MRAFVVLGLVFPYQAKRLAWGASPKCPILCQVERKTLTQSNKNRQYSKIDILPFGVLTEPLMSSDE